MIKTRFQFFFTFLTFCFFTSIHSQVLIWDLGGVLFKQSHFGIAHSIGLSRFASYALFDWRNPNIRPLLFDVLGSLGQQKNLGHQLICDDKGNALPQIMCDWLTGKIAPHDVIKTAHDHIEQLHTQTYFISTREKELLKETISVIFDPEYFAYYQAPIEQGLRLLHECASFCDPQGSSHTLIVLSNWDPYSFDILYENYRDIFDLFDHVIISGDIGHAKPHYSIFDHLLTTYKLDPNDCYFIDNQLINITAAEQCKIKGLWLKDGNYRDLKRRMKQLGLL